MEALKTELDNIRETHRLESASQEELIKELQLKVDEAKNEASKVNDNQNAPLLEKLQSELQVKQVALEESQRREASVQKMVEELTEQMKTLSQDLEKQTAEVYGLQKLSDCRGTPQRRH
jgi:hypothetical protein